MHRICVAIPRLPCRGVLCALFCAVLPAAGQTRGLAEENSPRGNLDLRVWFPDTRVGIHLKSVAAVAGDVSGRNDLGFQNPKLPEVVLSIHGRGRNRVRVSYLEGRWDGDNVLRRSISFGNRIYAVNQRVVSNLKLRRFDFGYSYQVVRAAGGKFQIGPMVKVIGGQLSGNIAAPSLSLSAGQSLPFAAPAVGAAMELRPHPKLHVSAEASGLKVGEYGSVVDGDLAARVTPVRHLSLGGGYRYVNLRPRNGDDFGVLRLNGPFVGAGLSW